MSDIMDTDIKVCFEIGGNIWYKPNTKISKELKKELVKEFKRILNRDLKE